jgi:hypothetical protein
MNPQALATVIAATRPDGADDPARILYGADDPARILSRIAQAMGLDPGASPRAIEGQVDLWIRTLVRIARAAGSSKLTDPAAIADAVEVMVKPGGPNGPGVREILLKLAESYEHKARLLREVVEDVP